MSSISFEFFIRVIFLVDSLKIGKKPRPRLFPPRKPTTCRYRSETGAGAFLTFKLRIT
nr:MAG TPA: hypothetical protein [Caudoviricetes sp.]